MIIPVWTAIVDGIRAGFESREFELSQCEKFGGRMDADLLETLGAHTPAVLVAILRMRNYEAHGRQVKYVLDCAAYCIAAATAAQSEDERVVSMVEVLTAEGRGVLTAAGNWGRRDCTPIVLETIAAQNLWNGRINEQGLAIWGVAWEQNVNTDPRLK